MTILVKNANFCTLRLLPPYGSYHWNFVEPAQLKNGAEKNWMTCIFI